MGRTDEDDWEALQKQECLSADDLAWLAGFIAKETGLRPIAPEAILNAYGGYDMPLVSESPKGKLWVDQYYIAYEGKNRHIHYAYLTREHIREESRAYCEASSSRKRAIRMPMALSTLFRKVKKDMNQNERNIWFEKPDVIEMARRLHYAYKV